MSIKKRFFGIILIILTFSVLFIIMIPTFYSNNPAGKFQKEINIDLKFLEKEKKPIVLIFFGYVGCTDICIPALKQIDEIFKKIDQDVVSFYFVNLLATALPQSVDEYAKIFNPKFNGIYLKKEDINRIISELNVLSVPSIFDKNIIDHSGFLHLFVKNEAFYKQKYIYTTSPFDVDFISKDINKIQGELK